jgi:aspartate/methionine/tyrosine aminotransferase
VIAVSAVSKTHAMTGWRIGYLAAALTGPQDCVAEMCSADRRRRDVAVADLRADGVLVNVPCGAFYVLADVGRVTGDTAAFARMLVSDHGVVVAPASTFGTGAAGFVRCRWPRGPRSSTRGSRGWPAPSAPLNQAAASR